MNLNDYIALSSKRPNRAVLQSLGASEKLIEYLMETPENTNWNILEQLSENEEDATIKKLSMTLLAESDFDSYLEAFQWCDNHYMTVQENGHQYIYPTNIEVYYMNDLLSPANGTPGQVWQWYNPNDGDYYCYLYSNGEVYQGFED